MPEKAPTVPVIAAAPPETRGGLVWIRFGVIAAVAMASAWSLVALSYALAFYDDKADHFGSLSARDRLHGKWRGVPTVIREPDVVELARTAMPTSAQYRVVIGSRWIPSYTSQASNTVEADFLRFYLLPRRQIDDATRWVFCFGCDVRTLGGSVRVLAGEPEGMQFIEVTG